MTVTRRHSLQLGGQSALATAGTRSPARVAAAALGVTVLVAAATVSWTTATSAALPVEGSTALGDGLSRALLRVVGLVATCATVGCLVLAVLARPSTEDAVRLASAAARWATLWTCCTAWAAVLRIGAGEESAALVLAAWASGAVAVLASAVSTRYDVAMLLALTWAALVASGLGSHATGGGATLVSVAGLLVHVAAVSVWVGVVLAIALHATGSMRGDPVLMGRVSRLALVCFVAVAASGVLNALSHVSWEALLAGEAFTVLVAVKIVLLAVLGGVGHRHRRRTLPLLVTRSPGPFRSLLRVEVATMVVVLGLAVALTQAAPEATTDGHDDGHASGLDR